MIERRDRAYVEHRLRAGVLEQTTVDLLRAAGVGERMDREGLVHEGLYLQFDGVRHRIALRELTGGRAITVYGQHEVVKDLIAARLAAGEEIVFEADDVRVLDIDGDHPTVHFRVGDEERTVHCDFVAGCDGFHGVCRPTIPAGALTTYERTYPFAWLGILAETPPSLDELVYAHHERGFALHSMRSPELTRLYVQCDARRHARRVAGRARLGGAASPPRDARRLGAARRAASSRRASRRCAASSSSRCSTAGSSSPATRRTSCRPPAPRGSTSPPPT